MVSTHRSKYLVLQLYLLEKKGRNVMEYRSRQVDSTQKWLLMVPALMIFSFSPAPGFLWTAQGQNTPSAQLPPATQTPAQKTVVDGTWQGTLHGGQDLRIMAKFSSDGGPLKATMYSIDQGGQPIAASSASFAGSVLKFEIKMIDGSYEGKLSGDGKSIVGTWTQGGNPLALVLERTTPATEWAIPAPRPEMPPMSADAKPGVEVATIKPAKPDAQGGGFIWDGRELKAINNTLASLICTAYNVQSKQIVGAPDWVFSEKFDVTAQPDMSGRPSLKQAQGMTRQLLTDRFQLKFHRDKKEMSAYVLTAIEGPPKMTTDTTDPTQEGLFFGPIGTLHVHNAPMLDFTQLLQASLLDRPVVDQTGLAGRWDFVLKWTPDDSQFTAMGVKASPPSDAADAPPPLYTAIREQLGLKLSSEKTAVDVIVIDHVDHPSPN
jgi:uncharacterized protein (TIGR03435 family)